MSSKVFYGVANGRTKGVFTTWAECDKSVKDFPNAKFKKFTSQEEAEQFVKSGFGSGFKTTKVAFKPTNQSKYSGVNFDSDSESEEEVKPKPKPKPKVNTWVSSSKQNFNSNSTTGSKTFINSRAEEDAIRANINFDSSDSESEPKPKSKTFISSTKAEEDAIKANINFDTSDSESELEFNDQVQTVKQPKPSDYPTELGDFIPDIIVYTDGACSSNGKTNAKAGIGVYFGPDDPRNISAPVQGKQSNNTAELGALIKAYQVVQVQISQGAKVAFFTDSVYGLWCLTTYGSKCAQTKWTKSIPNKELVKEAYELFGSNSNPNIKLIHVRSHTGAQDPHSLANEQADRLANLAIGIDVSVKKSSKPTGKSQVETNPGKKIYLKVPFEKKETAKKLGCRWDPDNKKWYCDESNAKALEQFGGKI